MGDHRASAPAVSNRTDEQCASVWFGRFERALICGDLDAASRADRALRRLGYALRCSLRPATEPSPSAEGARDE